MAWGGGHTCAERDGREGVVPLRNIKWWYEILAADHQHSYLLSGPTVQGRGPGLMGL